jgi:hypothetical protein
LLRPLLVRPAPLQAASFLSFAQIVQIVQTFGNQGFESCLCCPKNV